MFATYDFFARQTLPLKCVRVYATDKAYNFNGDICYQKFIIVRYDSPLCVVIKIYIGRISVLFTVDSRVTVLYGVGYGEKGYW